MWLRLLLASLLAAPAFATPTSTVIDLYSAQVPVDSRSAGDRRGATAAALGQVLVKITGDVSVSLSEAAEPLLRASERYLRSYRYLQVPGETPLEPARTELIAEFDAAALRQAVKNAGLPIWGERRPATLVWLVVPAQDGTAQWVSESQAPQWAAGLVEAARARGLPLIWPQADAGDEAISVADIRGRQLDRIEQASARYAPGQVLLISVEDMAGSSRARWSRLSAGDGPLQTDWDSIGRDSQQALSGGFATYADALAQQFAVRVASGWVQATQLEVGAVTTLAEYARVLAYLQDLQLVTAVELSGINADTLSFWLRFEGDLSNLERNLSLGGVLIEAQRAPLALSTGPVSSDGGLNFFAVGSQAQLRYQLRR